MREALALKVFFTRQRSYSFKTQFHILYLFGFYENYFKN